MNDHRLVVNEPESMRFQVHRSTLVDPRILELEQRRIFEVCWIYVGHESEVRAAGAARDGGASGHAGVQHPCQLEAARGKKLRRLPPAYHSLAWAQLSKNPRSRDEGSGKGPPPARAWSGKGSRQRTCRNRQREF